MSNLRPSKKKSTKCNIHSMKVIQPTTKVFLKRMKYSLSRLHYQLPHHPNHHHSTPTTTAIVSTITTRPHLLMLTGFLGLVL